jgi:hypothetical protein
VLDVRAVVRLGGICGILYVLLMICPFLVRLPIATEDLSVQEVNAYFDIGRDPYLFTNGLLFAFSPFFFVWFLGILHGTLRRAEGEGGGFASVAQSDTYR